MYSWDVLDNELVLLVPVPLLVCVPSIHKQTRGAAPHFLLKKVEISVISQKISLH